MEIKNIAITKTVADDSDFLLMQNPTTRETYKITKADLLAGISNNGSPSAIKLIGTSFGASPPYAAGSDYTKAFDGNLSTYYDYINSSDGYCGLDLGINNTKKLTKIRVYPRQDSGVHTRSGGAKIQGSNSETSGYTDLFTFPSTTETGIWYEGNVSISTVYRYLRYYAASGTYCSVAEIEFYGV